MDLFNEEEDQADRDKLHKDPDIERIESHLEQWNETALDAVFGMLTKPALKYVCLFINKIDKLQLIDSTVQHQEIKNKFKPLIDSVSIKAANSGAAFDIVIGSALKGTNIVGESSLSSKLVKYSV